LTITAGSLSSSGRVLNLAAPTPTTYVHPFTFDISFTGGANQGILLQELNPQNEINFQILSVIPTLIGPGETITVNAQLSAYQDGQYTAQFLANYHGTTLTIPIQITITGLTPPALPVPYLYYSFDEIQNGFVIDQSPNGRNGLIGGAPTSVAGFSGNGMEFNIAGRGDQYLNTGIANIQQTLTVIAWIRINDPNANNYMKVVSSKVNWNDPVGFEVEYNPQLDRFGILGSGDNVAFAEGVALDNNWHHLAVIINGNRNISLSSSLLFK
jgi:hypothetical protein